MNKTQTIVLTALVPCIWGSTFVVTTELLPESGAFTNASIRALVAGFLLLLLNREFPKKEWLWKIAIAGALNFSIFWWLLFVAAYRLPGGVAATVGSIQPLIVYALTVWLLNAELNWRIYVVACCGILGVAMLAITPAARIDLIGISAAIGGAFSMALGVVLTKRWQMKVSPLSFAAWQLIVGGALLLPVAIILEEPFTPMTANNLVGHLFLGVIGGAVTYAIWFKGISFLGPVIPTTLGFFSPLTAMVLGWLILDQTLTIIQILGAVMVLGSVITSVWLQTNGTRTFLVRNSFKQKGSILSRDPGSSPKIIEEYTSDPFSHPDIQKMSMRELSDLPIRPSHIPHN